MFFNHSHFSKFILLSVVIHLSVVGFFWQISHQEQRPIAIEIAFGTGPAPKAGGPAPIKIAPTPIKALKARVVAPAKAVVTDAPQIAAVEKKAEEKVIPQQEAQAAASNNSGVGVANGDGPGGNGDGGSPDGSKSALSKYSQQITKLINRHKKYPRMAYSLNQEGKVLVSLKLSKDGKILDLKLLDKSPYKSLATASLETIKKIHKFPPIPDDLKLSEISFSIPIEYKIEM